MSENITHIFETPIEYIKGVGPSKGESLRKDLNIHTLGDLVQAYPFRYVDRTKFHFIKDISAESDLIQLKGTLVSIEKVKGKTNRSPQKMHFNYLQETLFWRQIQYVLFHNPKIPYEYPWGLPTN